MTTTNAADAEKNIEAALEAAAKEMGFPDLRERRSDALDFREVGVLDARAALRRAYDAGLAAGRAARGRAANG